MMIRGWLWCGALGVLAACQPVVPSSNPSVVTSAQAQAQREAALAQPVFQSATPVAETPLAVDPATQPLPSSVTAAVTGAPDVSEVQASAAAAAANSGIAPVVASPSNPAPTQVSNPGISSEQDFASVSARRSIENDANRLAQNRAQYTLVTPTDLPTRAGTNQPNIVQYALRTDNPVGAQLYRRVNLRSAQRHAAACARFASPDQAQIEFLTRGGPGRDRKGLDPDGDGFACGWDPRPFRAARASAPPAPLPSAIAPQSPATAVTTAPPPGVVPPLVISSE